MRRLACLSSVVVLLSMAGCGASDGAVDGDATELGWIEGVIDARSGVVTYRTARVERDLDAAQPREQTLSAITENKNGVIGTSSAVDQVEFVVECNGGAACAAPFAAPRTVVNGCGTGINSFELDVTVRSFFLGGVASAYAEFTSVTNLGADGRANTGDAFEGSDSRPCNQDPQPRNLTVGGVPLSTAFGLYRYGQLVANPTAPTAAPSLAADSVRWKFRNLGGSIKFKARLVAEPCTSDCTPMRHAQSFWQADGGGASQVNAAVEGNGVVYLGGTFNYVGPRTGSAAALGAIGASANVGRAILPADAVEGGDVFAIAADGAGGAFLGGTFTSIGGVARTGLAHMLANGTVDAGFAADVSGSVLALTRVGSRLFVGGTFTSIRGTARTNLAAVDTTTGAVDAAWTAVPNNAVRAFVVDGGSIYVGGAFTAIGATAVGRLARFTVATGALDAAFASTVEVTSGQVNALAIGSSIGGDPTNLRLFLGGTFTTINGANTGGRGGTALTRNRIASVGTGDRQIQAFNPGASAAVNALLVSGTTVFAGGAFTTFGGVSRPVVASVSDTGTMQSFRSVAITSSCNALAFDAVRNILYVGGVSANPLAAVSGTTGAAQAWGANVGANRSNAAAARAVNALLLDGTTVRVGGLFRSAGGFVRLGAAALDLTTGEATAWAPFATQVNVNAMAVTRSGDVIIGSATAVQRVSQSGVGATTWTVASNAAVLALAVDSSDRVYVGGTFATLGGQARGGLAAVASADGSLLPWTLAANTGASVRAIAPFRSEIYVGGDFTSLGGNTGLVRFAVLNEASAAAAARRSWAANGTVFAIAPQRDAVFVGGAFTTIDGQARTRLAAVDGTSVTAFNVPVASTVNAIVAAGNNLHIGGAMTTVGAAVSCGRACTAHINGTASGSFNGALGATINSVAIAGPFVFVGGQLVNSAVGSGGFRTGNAVLLAD